METIEYNPDNLPSADADRWTPVRNGDMFCSPACGCKCKLADYERAVKAAGNLAALLGGGWYPNVWENGGWHYDVRKGKATVLFRGFEAKYVAEIEIDYISKSHILSVREEDEDPRRAVKALVSSLGEIIARISRAKTSIALESLAIEDLNIIGEAGA